MSSLKDEEVLIKDVEANPLPVSLEDSCGPLNFIRLGYMNIVYNIGEKKTLEFEDLGAVSIQDDCHELYVQFSKNWQNEIKKPHARRSLWMVLWRTVGWGRVALGNKNLYSPI